MQPVYQGSAGSRGCENPIVSIALSVWLFDERFKPGTAVLAVAVVAFAVMCVGVVFLTQTAPATMKPDIGQ